MVFYGSLLFPPISFMFFGPRDSIEVPSDAWPFPSPGADGAFAHPLPGCPPTEGNNWKP